MNEIQNIYINIFSESVHQELVGLTMNKDVWLLMRSASEAAGEWPELISFHFLLYKSLEKCARFHFR